MNITGFDKVAPYLTNPLVLWSCFGLLFLAVLLRYGERKGRLPHLVFFLILLVMVAVIYLGREEKAVWIPAAITMLGIVAPVALTWKSSVAGPNTAVSVDAGKVARELLAPLQGQLEAKDEQIKALTEAITALSKTGASTASINDALRALKQGDTAKAQAIFAEVLRSKEAEGRQANKEAAAAARHLGALAYMNDTKAALAAYRKAVELDPDDVEGWNVLGALLSRIGELAQAEKAYRKVLALAEAHQDKKKQAWAYGNLGNVYYTRGDLDKAKEMYRKALEINEALGSKQGMAENYGNLGNVYATRGELDKAKEMYRKTLELIALGNREGMAKIYGNLGNVYGTRNELDKAEEMYRKALALNEALGSREGMAANYGGLGTVAYIRRELDKAEEMHQKALKLHQALYSKEGMAQTYLNLGILYEERSNLAQAEAAWQKSLRLYQQMEATQHPDAMKVQQELNNLAQHRAAQQAPSIWPQHRAAQQAPSADNPR
jgi:tetratricopeptide (TPR) repeat protein